MSLLSVAHITGVIKKALYKEGPTGFQELVIANQFVIFKIKIFLIS